MPYWGRIWTRRTPNSPSMRLPVPVSAIAKIPLRLVTARTVFCRNIEAVEAEDERNGLGELKTALGQEVFHLLVPESLRLLVPDAALDLIGVVAPPDGMDDNADHGIDHGDQQLPVILENPPGFLQYLAPLRLRHVVQAGEHGHGVEVSIRERQRGGISLANMVTTSHKLTYKEG
jgi:hypothetical protein